MEIKNLYAYSKERFPFINMALFTILFFTVYCVATFTTGQLLHVGLNELVGSIAVISFFFRLRVFDEIKDYTIDAINHPHRVLQSGRIKLKHLTRISVMGGGIEIAWSFANGSQSLWWWLAALFFAVLMRYEFFISTFLKKQLLLYAFSHMLIMPLIVTWVWSAYIPVSLQENLVLLSSLSLFSGFAFEIARKIHIPDKEKPLIDSYSKELGYKVSITLVVFVLFMGVLTQFQLLQQISDARWPFLLIGTLYLLIIGFYMAAIFKPQEKKIRTSEVMVSLFMLFSYFSILIEIIL